MATWDKEQIALQPAPTLPLPLSEDSQNHWPPDDYCLHEMFERSAKRSPNSIALLFNDTTTTYADLEIKANRLAHYLRLHGVQKGSLVGIFLERSEMPIVALLAVLKAGAAYVPLDPVYPPDRILHILETTGIEILLTESALKDRVEGFRGTLVACDELRGELVEFSARRLSREENCVAPEDLCYIIFTSGTTGRPKGIMTEHRNVVGFFKGFNRLININPKDRVYQGFSLGFDGSVEEIWMAFTNGATLCIGTSEAARLGDEAHQLMSRYKATVFSTVPTFLGLIKNEIESLRLLIVSGEPCPPHLIDRWSIEGRRMLNVYGPTEATVNTTAALCKPGKPVTIGKALDGYDIHVLSENMDPVPRGDVGELYVGGVGISRGYFKQPELTQRHYVAKKDGSGKLIYRTGDLVSMNPDGELLFLGRVDSQVKVRGFRIELGEIESVLREASNVDQAVLAVSKRDQLEELAAYIVLKDTSLPVDHNEIVSLLNQRLPPYMVPAYLDVLAELPLTPSGKVDRKNLPTPKARLLRAKGDVIAPANSTEKLMVEAIKKVFSLEKVCTSEDFFRDLGGYSLLIVGLIAELRKNIDVSVRDAYKYTTVQALAKHVASNKIAPALFENKRSAEAVFHSVPRWERWACYTLQAITILFGTAVGSSSFVGGIWLIIRTYQGLFPLNWCIGILVTVAVLALPFSLSLSILLKWAIVGKYKPGRYPLWSLYYFRFWLASRVQAMSGVSFVSATPLMSIYYRLMGAKIGKRCTIDTQLCAIYDLLTIGDDSSIGSETQLLGYRVEDGELIIGSIAIGRGCFVGTHSCLGLNVRMENNTILDDLSLLPDNGCIAENESWRGSPAQSTSVEMPQIPVHEARNPLLYGFLHIIALEVFGLTGIVTTAIPIGIMVLAYFIAGIPGLIASTFVTAFFGIFYYCFVVAGLKYLILPKVKPGVYSTESLFYIRKWLVDLMLSGSRVALHSLYTTIYFPAWLRLLGAKVGKGAEISTVSQLYPDLTEIGDESFFADGSMIGGRKFYKGHVYLDTVKIGRRSFVGNNARMPVGGALGENSLLGCLSGLPEGQKCPQDGTEWLGSPSFELPNRKKECEFDVTEIFKPTKKLVATRCVIDALRIFIPTYIGLISGLSFLAFGFYGVLYMGAVKTLALAPVVTLLLSLLVGLSAVVIKWALMGQFKPVRKPLWSVYVWLNELVNGVYETVAVPAMSGFMGTPFYNWYLRLMGCQIGKNAYIGTSLFSEFDLVKIGDYACLNSGVIIQNHLFEDRVMKSSYLEVGNECSVGNMSVVLYDSKVGNNTIVSPLSLIMKGDTVPSKTRWIGIPVIQN